jgi:hypothetical protein
MPTETEHNFFKAAYQLLDQQNGTIWLQQYNHLTSRNSDGNIINLLDFSQCHNFIKLTLGRINWKDIPGLLPPQGSAGYNAAIKRTAQLVKNLKPQIPKYDYKNVKRLAKEVYESRRSHQRSLQRKRGFLYYYLIFLNPFCNCDCAQDEDTLRHTAAKQMWKDAWNTLNN